MRTGEALGADVVVLFQPPANLAGLHSNNGVISSRIARFALKDLRSNGALLKELIASF